MKIPSINNSVAPLLRSGAEAEVVAEAEATAAGGKLATTFYAINKVTTKITKTTRNSKFVSQKPNA